MKRRPFSRIAWPWVSFALALISPVKAESPFGSRDQSVISAKDLEDLVITPVAIASLPRKTFKVGRVGEIGEPKREDLLALFTAFQTQYAVDAAGKITGAAPWKDTGLAEITFTLQQEPQHGLHLLGSDPANCVFLKNPPDCTWALGDKVHLLALKTGVQAWTPGGDIVVKSPLYEPLTLPLPAAQTAAPTREQFIAALRAGQTFDILIAQPAKPADANALPVLIVQKLVW